MVSETDRAPGRRAARSVDYAAEYSMVRVCEAVDGPGTTEWSTYPQVLLPDCCEGAVPRRQPHPAKKIREPGVTAQAIEPRIDFQPDHLPGPVLESMFQPFEGALFIA